MTTPTLPKTVSVLHCPNGSQVFLVGTAHFSRESAEDVRRTISQVRPDIVVVELCYSRGFVLMYTEEKIKQLAKETSWQSLREAVQREGLVASLTQLIFVKISNDLMEKLGVVPGGEFRAAYSEAVRLNVPVHFGDRRIELTFKRMLYSLSLRQQFRFLYLLLSSAIVGYEITAEEVEKMKEKDMIELLTSELAAELSTVTKVLVDERDIWLTHSLMKSANCWAEPFGPPVRVVGVVGMGHVKGITKNWMDVRDVKELVKIPKPPMTSTVFWAYVRFGILTLCTVGLYKFGRACLRFLYKRIMSFRS